MAKLGTWVDSAEHKHVIFIIFPVQLIYTDVENGEKDKQNSFCRNSMDSSRDSWINRCIY